MVSFVPTVPGTYQWVATYSGDSNNPAISSPQGEEPETVIPASPSITTSASFCAGNVVGSAVLRDAATITGGYNVTGTVSFSLTLPSGTTISVGSPVAVNGTGTYNSPTYTATQVGTYTWHATYSGDTLNNGAVDNGVNESLSTVKATPCLVTQASLTYKTNPCGSVTGSAIPQDTAVLSGGYNIGNTGTLTFVLKAPDGSTADTEVINVNGAGTYKTNNLNLATQVGTYTWLVTYSGDTLNLSVNDQGGPAEQVVAIGAPVTISGKKYNDIKGNDSSCGGIGSDDVGLAGVTINLYLNGGSTPVASTLTGADGSYSFTNLAAGTYTVKEVVPSGWTQTYGKGGYTISAVGGQTYTGKNFADFENITISGLKYNDLNGDGNRDAGEPGLAGWVIDLTNGCTTITATTGSDGTYSFTNVGPGTYTVTEESQSGWLRTSLPANYTVIATSGNDVSGLVFGNIKVKTCNCEISNIYYVINGCTTVTDISGKLHQGDTVKVYFTLSSAETISFVSYTAPDSYFVAEHASEQVIFDSDTGSFSPGQHSLTIVVPNCNYQVDFICGTPIETLGPAGSNNFYTPQGRLFDADNGGTTAQCTFIQNCGGNSSISGSVYSDRDNDGKKDAGEAGIANVKVVLTGTSSIGQKVKIALYTDASGNYKFTGLKAGTYKVTEGSCDAYFDGKDTAGSSGGTVSGDIICGITIGNGVNCTGNNFGELDSSSISGTVYKDVNTSGTLSSTDTGLANVKITLTGVNDLGASVTIVTYTDANGNFSFVGLRKGTYSVTEATPLGYRTKTNTVGLVNGVTDGTVSGDSITNIALAWGVDGAGYNFGEVKI